MMHSFFIRISNILESFNVLILFLFFCQFEPQVFLPGLLKKLEMLPLQKGKNEILKNFPRYKSIVYKKLLIDSKRLL